MSDLKTEWYKDEFFVSTNHSLLQPAAINAAFATDMIYWAKAIKDEALLKKMLDKSMCFGLYELPNSSSDIAGRNNPKQIGLARLITDEVTFAYLTDVYILPEYQGKGLGKWLIGCVDENLSLWPELRRALLITTRNSTFYADSLKMEEFEQDKSGLAVFRRRGPGAVDISV